MDMDTLMFFDKKPEALPLYEVILNLIRTEFEDFTVKVQKTQIAFSNKYNFAFVWLPFRRMKGRPETCVILTFGLNRRLEDARIFESAEPYPGRWTHHVIIQREDDIDDQIKDWLVEAYQFSLSK